jgi:CheY-like chemotaxis protein
MKTILVVEDHSYARQFMCWMLQRSGYCTLDAGNAEEAYDVLTYYRDIDLVLSDFDIPGYNGFDLLRTIKSNPMLEDMPIVLLTAEYHTDKILYARQSGMASFIQKPISEENLLTEIDRAINTKGSIINVAA